MSVNTTRQDEASVASSKKMVLFRLYAYLLAYKLRIAIVLFIMLLVVGITLVNPLLIEHAINISLPARDYNDLYRVGIIAIVMNLSLIVLVKLRMYLMAKLSNQVLLKIRQELYTHIQKLSFHFFDSRPIGKILARIIGDVNSLKDLLSNSVTTLIPDFITVIAVVVIMMIKNWKLALASLISLPLMILGIYFVQTRAHKRWVIFRKKGSNLNAYLHESISGIRVIQSFHAEDEALDSFDDFIGQHRGAFLNAIVYADAFGPVVDFCWGLGSLAMYYMGVKIIGANQVPVGTLMAFATYISMFWHPIMNLSNFYNQLVTNMAGAERIFEILDTDPEITDNENAVPLPNVQGAVTFRNVSFSYDENTSVLENVSFHVKPGETIALVGPTGAGKTTIINLISRFYDIQKGNILIDNHSLAEVTIESLREQMGIMTQDNFLFTGTIRDNIKYGKLDATDEEMIAAAKAVNAHDFIMKLEKGYDTEIKERGAGFSVGQKQLIAFARTMVAKPNILILDEATSSIDTHTELMVQKGIESMLKGRTSFVIAHRLSTIKKADRIFVIDQGGIIEQGTPTELLEKKGVYHALYMSQFCMD